MKEENGSNHHYRGWQLDHGCAKRMFILVQRSLWLVHWMAKQTDVATPPTVLSIVYHSRSWLYTSVIVAMMIYHTSCPAGPRHDKSHIYLHLSVYNQHISPDYQLIQAYCKEVYWVRVEGCRMHLSLMKPKTMTLSSNTYIPWHVQRLPSIWQSVVGPQTLLGNEHSRK